MCAHCNALVCTEEKKAPGSQSTLAGSCRADCTYQLLQGLGEGSKTVGATEATSEQRKLEPHL